MVKTKALDRIFVNKRSKEYLMKSKRDKLFQRAMLEKWSYSKFKKASLALR